MRTSETSRKFSLVLAGSLAFAFLTVCSGADAQMVYWADVGENTIRRAGIDGSGVELLVSGSDAADPADLALDLRGGKIYWCGLGPSSVRRANLDGSNVEVLTTTGVDGPTGIALDVASGHMYVTSFSNSQINRYNLDGTGYLAIHTFPAGSWPRGIDLDLDFGKMYYQLQGTSRIERSDLDGSHVESLVDPTGSTPHDLSLDINAGKIYWLELGTDAIRRCNLDGSGVETVVGTGDRPRGLALDLNRRRLWWTKPAGTPPSQLRRSTLDGAGIQTILSGPPLDDPWGIELDSTMLSGAVIYDNGSTNPALDNGNEMSAWVQADDFELASPMTLTGIFVEWIEIFQGSWDGQIQWYIFADNAGAPGTLLHQGTGIDTSTVLFATDNGWFWYQTDVMFDSGVVLPAGVRYWIGLHWAAPGDFNGDTVYWASTQIGGFGTTGHESGGGTFDNWANNTLHRAFRLLGREPCYMFCDGFESSDTTQWSNTEGYMLPSYEVNDGPRWTTNPPVYSCLEACAVVFGGAPSDWQCSTSETGINNMANASTWGVGCATVAEDYSLDQGGGYNCGSAGCSTSAYVGDNCSPGVTNYCWPG